MALDLNDKTSNGNNLTNVNTATENTADLPFATNNVRTVDLETSSSQYLKAADSASLSLTGDMTIECWIKFESIPTGYIAFLTKWKDGTGQDWFLGLLNQGSLEWYINGAAGACSRAWSPSTATWYHVAASHSSGGEMKVFIDGAQLGTTATGQGNTINDNDVATAIGAQDTPAFYFDGLVDDVRIWNTVRTVTQIADNRSIQLTGTETGLVAYWPFEPAAPAAVSESVRMFLTTNTRFFGG